MLPATEATATSECIARAVQIIVSEVDPEQIILFGSLARGDAHGGSDTDLLVVERAPLASEDTRRRHAAGIYRALARVPANVDVLIASADEAQFWRDARNHVIARALREGRVVYDRR